MPKPSSPERHDHARNPRPPWIDDDLTRCAPRPEAQRAAAMGNAAAQRRSSARRLHHATSTSCPARLRRRPEPPREDEGVPDDPRGSAGRRCAKATFPPSGPPEAGERPTRAHGLDRPRVGEIERRFDFCSPGALPADRPPTESMRCGARNCPFESVESHVPRGGCCDLVWLPLRTQGPRAPWTGEPRPIDDHAPDRPCTRQHDPTFTRSWHQVEPTRLSVHRTSVESSPVPGCSIPSMMESAPVP
jgi:hypothetical protein